MSNNKPTSWTTMHVLSDPAGSIGDDPAGFGKWMKTLQDHEMIEVWNAIANGGSVNLNIAKIIHEQCWQELLVAIMDADNETRKTQKQNKKKSKKRCIKKMNKQQADLNMIVFLSLFGANGTRSSSNNFQDENAKKMNNDEKTVTKSQQR